MASRRALLYDIGFGQTSLFAMDQCKFSVRFWWILLYITIHCLYSANCATRIVATAPVNPVNEGELLSIHCQVWDLNPNHEVSIHRQLDHKTERLTVNEDVMSTVDDRVFIAVRLLADGSAVYFLTITDVTRQDSGNYSCKVVNAAEVKKVAESDLNITIHYFPSEVNPVCGKLSQQEWLEGTTISLNCTSEKGNPPVRIEWKQGALGSLPEARYISRGDMTYSELNLRLTTNHNGALFLCEIRSKPFGNKVSSCHIGPIAVRPNKNGENKLETPTVVTKTKPGNTETGTIPKLPVSKDDCLKNCSPYSTSVLFWVIATVASAVIALIFLLMGATLIVKYMRIRQTNQRTFMAQRVGEDIYAEVESKNENRSRLYMSLQRPDTGSFRIVSPKQEYHKDYHEATTVAKL
ncbi:uncharacterized protein [Amphiura filiformis]|uniref:uncharacterized protein n=1 Tax=Amphiura filiformis TaxID=82378 RepID=UPI003B2154B9